MSYKTILVTLAAFVLGAFSIALLIKSAIQSPATVEFHEHADFAVFINGKKFDFSGESYMSTKPCTIEENERADDDVVHLHDLDGGVIHVHRAGVTYADFFQSLHMSFSDTAFSDDAGNTYANNETQSLRFFVNGTEVQTLAGRDIRDLDQILITYGPRNRTMESINQELGQVSNRACVSSRLCDHRGPVAEESCSASTPKQSVLFKWLGL